MTSAAVTPRLRSELMQLFEDMEAVRHELATIRHPEAQDDKLKSMAEHLDAIVQETEQATETILGANEQIEGLLDQIGQCASDPKVSGFLDEIAVQVAEMYQACSFQDITGQWVNKAATSLKTIDDSIGRLVDLWGEEGFSDMEPLNGGQKDKLLNGPQIGGAATSQDDIDQMFD